MLCSLSLGKMLLFMTWLLSCLMMVEISSICLIASNMFWCTLDELITSFLFCGWISRVHLVLNLLFTTVAVAACSIWQLHIVF